MSISLAYRAAHESLLFAHWDGRTEVELTGDDRATFLHNLSTNHIKDLRPGGGCEAFLLNAQGRILFHLVVYCTPESLQLSTLPHQNERLMSHLDRYLIREKVQLHDHTAEWSQSWLLGPQAEHWLTEHGADLPAHARLSHCPTRVCGQEITLRRADVFGPQGFALVGSVDAIKNIEKQHLNENTTGGDPATLEVLRIEAGFPAYGYDITDKNLPQEVARDAQAIHFQKGCYIGQETVARIDALGHVNRLLAGVTFSDAEVPQAGGEITHAGDVVGHVTSAVFSPKFQAPLALAYLRRGHHLAGTKLDDATVVELTPKM